MWALILFRLSDNMDGTYEVSFLLTEPGYYNVTLSLEYTLCDGFKDPPPRWFNLGKIRIIKGISSA